MLQPSVGKRHAVCLTLFLARFELKYRPLGENLLIDARIKVPEFLFRAVFPWPIQKTAASIVGLIVPPPWHQLLVDINVCSVGSTAFVVTRASRAGAVAIGQVPSLTLCLRFALRVTTPPESAWPITFQLRQRSCIQPVSHPSPRHLFLERKIPVRIPTLFGCGRVEGITKVSQFRTVTSRRGDKPLFWRRG